MKTQIKESYIFKSLILFIIASLIIDIFGIKLITIPNTEQEYYDLVVVLFNIQASISTLGIALLALLTESVKEKLFGIQVGHHLMTNHYKYLTHHSIIMIEIIILIFNYFFLTFKWLNASVSLFIVSLILIIFLTSDILKLFTDVEIIFFRNRK